MNEIRAICVYCGSSPGNDAAYVEGGERLGSALAAAGVRLIYGGGTTGVMGAVAHGILSAGGVATRSSRKSIVCEPGACGDGGEESERLWSGIEWRRASAAATRETLPRTAALSEEETAGRARLCEGRRRRQRRLPYQGEKHDHSP